MDLSTIKTIVNLSLLGVFILIVLIIGLSALVGYKKGAFKVSYKLLFMLVLFLTAIFTLTPITNLVYRIPLNFLGFQNVVLSNPENGLTYYAPITNVFDTTYEALRGIFYLFNVHSSPHSAHVFAIGLVTIVIKFAVFFAQMVLILTLGNLFAEIMWHIAFKHLVPKVIMHKGKLCGLFMNAVKSACIIFLFISPLTVFVNMANQNYQRFSKTQQEPATNEIINFIDAYNSSLFAQVFFNWTTNADGLTFDAALMDSITSTTIDGTKLGLISELNNLIGVAVPFVDCFTNIGDKIAFDATLAISDATINNTFECLKKSKLLVIMLPIAAEIVTNSNVVGSTFDLTKIDASEIKWQDELDQLKIFVESLLNTGILGELYGPNGVIKDYSDAKVIALVKKMLNDQRDPSKPDEPAPFEYFLDAFQQMAKSKLLDKTISALLDYAISMDTSGTIKQYVPMGWDDINNVSWGTECYILIDSLHSLYAVDPDIIDYIFEATKKPETPTEEGSTETTNQFTGIVDYIVNNCESEEQFNKVKAAIIGDLNETGLDRFGKTVGYKDGKRIEGRHYSLLDLQVFSSLAIPMLNGLFNIKDGAFAENVPILPEDKNYLSNVLDELNQGKYILNYKKEFSILLDVVREIGSDRELLNDIFSGKPIVDNGNVFSIDTSHIAYLKRAVSHLDRSKLLYATLTPILRGFMYKEEVVSAMGELGISSQIMAYGMGKDMKRESHNLYHQLNDVFDLWESIKVIFDPMKEHADDSNAIIRAIATPEGKLAVAKVLGAFQTTEFFNPDPGDDAPFVFEHNENFYRVLENVFKLVEGIGINITREDLKAVENNGHKWSNAFDAENNPILNDTDNKYGECWYIASIIEFIGAKDYINNISDLNFGDASTLRKLANNGENDLDVPGLMAKVDDSVLFSRILGGFLDKMTESAGLLDAPEGVDISFSNVVDWKEEGENFGKMLNCLADVIDLGGGDFLNSFDITAISDIPKLNTLFHKLANSGIFRQKGDNGNYTYTFGKFLYSKVKPVLSSFDLGGNKNLIKDPDVWDASKYGNRPIDGGSVDPYFEEYYNLFATEEEKAGTSNTYYLVYRDFVSIDGTSTLNNKASWCQNDEFDTLNEAFTYDSTWTSDNEYNAIYGSDNFVNAYNDIFDLDELGRVCRVLTFALRLKNMASFDLNNLKANTLEGALGALNESSSMQIGIYNISKIAKDLVGDDASASGIINLNAARFDYLIPSLEDRNNMLHYRENRAYEINTLVDCIDTYQTISNKGIVSAGDYDASKFDAESLTKISNMFKRLNISKVFHRLGSALDLEGYNPTVFQGVIENIIVNTPVGGMLYNESSPKDLYYKSTYQTYISTNFALATDQEKGIAKTRFLVDTNFLELSDEALASYSDSQLEEIWEYEIDQIDEFFETVAVAYGYEYKGEAHTPLISGSENFSDININTINPELVGGMLKQFTDSILLEDLAPNVLSDMFSHISFSGGLSIDFTKASPYYFYEYNGTVSNDFTRVLPDEEIDRICTIIQDYQSLNEILGSRDFTSKEVIQDLNSSGILEDILTDTHNSEMLHVYNSQNVNAAPALTVFEQIISEIMVKTKLSDYAYDAVRDASYGSASIKLLRKIKDLSSIERNNGMAIYSYHTAWINNQEIKAVINFLNGAVELAGDSMNFDDIDLTTINPNLVAGILEKMNKVDVVAEAVPYFVKEALETTKIHDLCEFEGVNYAYYYHNQKVYGGAQGNCEEGTDIYLLKQAMLNFSHEVGGHYEYYDSTSITDLATELDNFDGLMNFISNSKILNTRKYDGSYDYMNSIETGINVSARGVLMYNLLSGNMSDANCSQYIIGANARQKAHALSKIFTLNDYSYLAESKGIYELMKSVSDIDPATFNATSFEDITAKKTVISNLMSVSYSAYNNKRSYFISEVLAGIFEDLLPTERDRITTLGLTVGNPTYRFKADSYDSIGIHSYDNLNQDEKLGFEGAIELIQLIGDLTSFPPSATLTRAKIVDPFVKMENSELARVYYTSRGHKQYPSETMRLDFTQKAAASAYYGSVWSDYTQGNNVWANTFSFTSYGNSLADYLGF